MSTTALDLITDALIMNGSLAEGEDPSNETAQDSLSALNMMIDAWSIDRLAVYATQKQQFSWPGNTATRTIGPTGDFVGNRPVSIDKSTYFTDANNNSYPLTQISEDTYNSISVKTSTSAYPDHMFVNMTHPDATMSVYPVPTSALTFNIVSILELTQPATLQTVLVFPPGYLRAFKFNLAVEVASMDGTEPMQTVSRIAISSKKAIKRMNTSIVDMRMNLPSSVLPRNANSDIIRGY